MSITTKFTLVGHDYTEGLGIFKPLLLKKQRHVDNKGLFSTIYV